MDQFSILVHIQQDSRVEFPAFYVLSYFYDILL